MPRAGFVDGGFCFNQHPDASRLIFTRSCLVVIVWVIMQNSMSTMVKPDKGKQQFSKYGKYLCRYLEYLP